MLDGIEPPPPDPIIGFMHTVDVVCGQILSENAAILAAAFREYAIGFATRRLLGLSTEQTQQQRKRLKDRLSAENYWDKRKLVDIIDTLVDLTFPMPSER